ncbi:hypothetical protein ABGB14_29255 [Nonomuraea sp. B10E15]|uniref:hypothetical protein n=1 Tax=Nonomuraea sp. B10E15 TaxID=3153560 RepID=UPI00325DDEA9
MGVEVVDEAVDRHHLATGGQQAGEHGTLAGPAQRDRLAVEVCGERAEHAEGQHDGDTVRQHRARGTSTLTLHQWEPISVIEEAEEEGRRLLEFLAPDDKHAIAVADGPSRS